MIEKGRSDNKGIYALLFAALAILAGTAYGIFSFFSNSTAAAPASTPAQVQTQAPAKTTNTAPNTSDQVAPGNTTPSQAQGTAPAATPDEHHYSIHIKKSTYQLNVLDNGKVVASFDCTLGKNKGDKEKSGDMKTPNGTFKVIEVCDASYWTHDFKDGKGEIKGAYGPWFFYLDTNAKSKGQWDGIGIHGTHLPERMRENLSEGCIRLRNENIELLKSKYITVGTMVTIEE